MNLSTPRAKRCIEGIFAVMQTGRWISRPFIEKRFCEAGYAPALAARKAEALIVANTDIQHFSRWTTRSGSYGSCPIAGDSYRFVA